MVVNFLIIIQGKMKEYNSYIRISKYVPYIIMLFLMVLVIANKKNLHIDESFSYGLANHIGNIYIEYKDGITYAPSEEPYMDYLGANAKDRFNYANVWSNQAADVHPPLYYAIIHTICSFFPQTFSMWYAGIVNIVFMLLTFYFTNKLLQLFIDDENYIFLFDMMFALSAGLFSAVSFFRMYIVAMCWCTILTYLFCYGLKQEKLSFRYYAVLLGTSILGALTHYYCIVYLFFLCAVYGVMLIVHRQWKKLGLLIAVEGAAAMFSVMVFPTMIQHMFFGYRGTEAISNLSGAQEQVYWDRLKAFWGFLNIELFGGILSYIVIAAAITLLVIFFSARKQQGVGNKKYSEKISYVLLIMIPVVLYFLLISKMAAYVTNRYIYPIYTVTMVGVFYLIYKLLGNWLTKKAKTFAILVLVTLFTVNGWKNIGWPYLYLSSQELLDNSKKYAEVDSVFIYDVRWKTQPAYLEVANYKSITFIPADNLNMIDSLDFMDCKELMVVLINDATTDKILNTVINKYPLLDKWEKIGGHHYTTTYHLYGDDKNISNLKITNYARTKYLGSIWNQEQGITDVVLSSEPSTIRALELTDEYKGLWVNHKVLDVHKAAFADHTNVIAFDNNNSDAQKWRFVKNSDGSYTIESFNKEYVLTSDDEGKVFIARKNGSDYQKWWIE